MVREEGSRARAAVLSAVAAALLASRAAGGKLERAHSARADPAEGLDDDGDDHVVLLLDAVVVVALLRRDVAAACRVVEGAVG